MQEILERLEKIDFENKDRKRKSMMLWLNISVFGPFLGKCILN